MSKRKRAHPAHYLEYAARITQTLINHSEDKISAKDAAKMFNDVHKDIAPPDPKPQPEVNNQQPPAEQVETSINESDYDVDELHLDLIKDAVKLMSDGIGHRLFVKKIESDRELGGINVYVTVGFTLRDLEGEKVLNQLSLSKPDVTPPKSPPTL